LTYAEEVNKMRQEERRKEHVVKDKKVEIGISLSVILQTVMAVAIIWVGNSINEGNRLLENHNVRIEVLEKVVDEHIEEYKKTVLFKE